jgi:hypothetical protein
MPENIDWEFIASLEGKGKTDGYVPDASGSKSGVTIATGFDLGQRNESDLTNLGLSSDLVTKLKPYLGKKGTDASDYLDKNPLSITETEAADIDKKVRQQKVPKLKDAYRTAPENTKPVEFDDLPGQAQTVIASVSFQYGTLSTKTPKFWKAVTKQDWPESVKILRAFGDSYPTRRGKEADRLEQVVKFNEMMAKLLSYIPFWVVLIMIFGVSCSTVQPQKPAEIYDISLQKAIAGYDAAAAENRAEVKFDAGKTAHNCTEYWAAETNSKPVEETVNMTMLSGYRICDALKLLKNSAGTAASAQVPAEDMNAVFERLDLTSFRSSLAQIADDEKHTFALLKETLGAKIDGNKIICDADGRNFVLTIAAAADADSDGGRDLIAWITDELDEGTYRGYSTVVIRDVDKDGVLKADAVSQKNDH